MGSVVVPQSAPAGPAPPERCFASLAGTVPPPFGPGFDSVMSALPPSHTGRPVPWLHTLLGSVTAWLCTCV